MVVPAGVEALYVSGLVGAVASGDHITNIHGFDGLTIYYDPRLAVNSYLQGLNYFLTDGGELVANVPEPASIAVVLVGLGAMGWRRRAARKALKVKTLPRQARESSIQWHAARSQRGKFLDFATLR